MDIGKQSSWDSWSYEYEPQIPKDDNDNNNDNNNDEIADNNDYTTKRPYECTFCKRGFTNAQALGGHMNIHRKDRAKAKHRNFLHSNSSSSSSSSSAHQIFPPISTQPTAAAACYPLPPNSHLNGYRMYFDTAAAANFPIQHRSQNSEELLGANLSLQIDQNMGVWKNEELDLELRLGHEYR